MPFLVHTTFCSLFIPLQLFAHFSYFYKFLLTVPTFAAFRGSAFTRSQIAQRDTLLCRRCFRGWREFLLFEKYNFFRFRIQNNAQTIEVHTAIELKR